MKLVLVTNNPAFFSLSSASLELQRVEGPAFTVVLAARDRIHQGWELLNHPLYGNYRPEKVPFRSLLLASPSHFASSPFSVGSFSAEADYRFSSLRLIEQALQLYRTCPVSGPTLSPRMRDDFMGIDQALLADTLSKAGVALLCS